MELSLLLRTVRNRSGATLRVLAERAQTSHPTLSAYENGRKRPSLETVERIAQAAGFVASLELVGRTVPDDRGEELAEVLALAELFPARHSPVLTYPPFRRRSTMESNP
jgi:transcriptional regulator with XRE-family HTH domain